MNTANFFSDNAVLFVPLLGLIFLVVLMSVFSWCVENLNEEKRRNQYRIIADFDDPSRFRVQNRWKTLLGWSKWSGWRTYGTLEQARAVAHEQAEVRIAKLCIPKVIEDLGVLP